MNLRLRRNCPHLTLLALAMASGLSGSGLQPLTPFHLMAIQAQESRRAERVVQDVRARLSRLGLGPEDAVAETGRFTDVYGQTHVHFQQTHGGVKVWNSHLIGHLDADGRALPVHATVQRDIQLPPANLLDPARVEALAMKHLPGTGKTWPLQVETIVFPAACQDGLKLARNEAGGLVLDRVYSVGSPARTTPYVWAFHVSAMSLTPDGPQGTELILDGRTGELLKKWDGGQHLEGPDGIGKTQYNGTVHLDTERQSDGTFLLRDTTRATLPWPQSAAHPTWSELSGVGIQTLYYSDYATTDSGMMPLVNATNTWGDGLPFQGILGVTNAETAAADAHYAIQTTWDYYAKVLGRTGGIDGLGHSPISLVHYTYGGQPWANAAWNPSFFMMMYGDGDAKGALASLDVAAHEMSHGVMSATAQLSGGEAGGINEANSDIHATMVRFWAWGTGAQGTSVPETTTTSPDGNNDPRHLWTIGTQLSENGAPLRWIYKPSLDGVSYDAWFDGIALDDVHLSMGPGNRAFFFLAQGASSDATKDTYSPYLPAGMNGIGNDKAIRIWFHGMATKVTDPSSDYHAVRAAMVESATELYPGVGGADSPETAAIKNAFAAVNVGAPEGGTEPPVVAVVNDGSALDLFGDSRFIVAPALETVRLPQVAVANSASQDVTWSVGGLSMLNPPGGLVLDSSRFVAPFRSHGNSFPLKAVLNGNPLQFAVENVYSVGLDCDEDAETDACDMGALALSFQVSPAPYPGADLLGDQDATDLDCQLFLLGFNRAFNL